MFFLPDFLFLDVQDLGALIWLALDKAQTSDMVPMLQLADPDWMFSLRSSTCADSTSDKGERLRAPSRSAINRSYRFESCRQRTSGGSHLRSRMQSLLGFLLGFLCRAEDRLNYGAGYRSWACLFGRSTLSVVDATLSLCI